MRQRDELKKRKEAAAVSLHEDLGGITSNQHHNESHGSAHGYGGAQEINLQELSGEPTDTVNKTGNQTIAGVKTFSSIPVGPATDPTTDNQLARKAYVDKVLTFTELFPASWLATSATTWEDKDLSAFIPAGGKYAIIRIINNHESIRYTAGVRKNGSALERKDDICPNYGSYVDTVELDAGRIIEQYAETTVAPRFQLLGYWA